MLVQKAIINTFAELSDAITQLTDEAYTKPSKHLSGATIGQHTRHIIELFQCLINGYDLANVNYEKRKRDLNIEQSKHLAISLLQQIETDIYKADKEIIVTTCFVGDEEIKINSNFLRELVYNLEHTIHHMALIRVGIAELSEIILPDTFGVAPSTIEYRRICAQ